MVVVVVVVGCVCVCVCVCVCDRGASSGKAHEVETGEVIGRSWDKL